MNVRKAVIPAAGFGTRMLPAAKSVPKELLPVLDRPTIQYVVEEASAAGADDVLLVTSRDKKAVEDHFDRSPELEQRLEAGGKSALLASVNDLMARAKVYSVRQPTQRGLGDAVNQARRHVGNEPFLCLLGDTIFSVFGAGNSLPASQLVAAHREFGGTIIGLEEVPPEKQAEVYPAQLQRLNDIEERVNRISIPLSFADELYGLRSHINFVRRRVASLMQAETTDLRQGASGR